MMFGPGSLLGFRDIDLTGIRRVSVDIAPAAGSFLELHIDGPEGEIIGQTEAAQKSGSAFQPEEIKIKNLQGRHNVYFVCKNQKASANDFMMNIRRIEFKNK
jgi:hypothetical protein